MTVTYEKAITLTEKTFCLIPHKAINALIQTDEDWLYFAREGAFDEPTLDFGYFTSDTIINDWIKDNIEYLTHELNFIIYYLPETLGFILMLPLCGSDFNETYFLPFWEAYYDEV